MLKPDVGESATYKNQTGGVLTISTEPSLGQYRSWQRRRRAALGSYHSVKKAKRSSCEGNSRHSVSSVIASGPAGTCRDGDPVCWDGDSEHSRSDPQLRTGSWALSQHGNPEVTGLSVSLCSSGAWTLQLNSWCYLFHKHTAVESGPKGAVKIMSLWETGQRSK